MTLIPLQGPLMLHHHRAIHQHRHPHLHPPTKDTLLLLHHHPQAILIRHPRLLGVTKGISTMDTLLHLHPNLIRSTIASINATMTILVVSLSYVAVWLLSVAVVCWRNAASDVLIQVLEIISYLVILLVGLQPDVALYGCVMIFTII